MTAESRRAVLLDRDGTVIPDVGYLRDAAQVELLPNAADALAALAQRGYLLVLVSNQSGIGRGWITPQEASEVHRRFVAELAAAGVVLDAAYYCPHAPNAGCSCRKPQPGLLLDAAREHGIDLHHSIMIGNSATDIDAGRAVGAFTILLGAHGAADPQAADAVAGGWDEVCDIVAGQTPGRV
jgi:D-glycero-D-manno-heptose 1,7-bisphosphate phosphatase